LITKLYSLIWVAILLLLVEGWALFRAYRGTDTLLSLTIYLCHGVNFLLFLPLYAGYGFAKADTSEDSQLPRVEVNVRDGDKLKNMIILRGMERGVLLWNGKETVFLPWASINCMSEGTNDAASCLAKGSE
jgi:hypothetical protein